MVTKLHIVVLGAALAVAGCETHAAITDIGQDKVRVQAMGDDVTPVNAQAAQACAMYKRQPRAISWRCLDGYCIHKEFLFACVPPE